MCSSWLSFSAFATVLCALVSSSSYSPTYVGFSGFSSSSPQQSHVDFYNSRNEENGGLSNPVKQYVRRRRRIQGGPPNNFRPQDIFEIENPRFNSPQPRPQQSDDRRNIRPIEERNPSYSEIDGLRALQIRRPFEEERQEPSYTSGRSQSPTTPTLQKLEPILHQRIRPPVTYRLADDPQYTISHDDTRPATVVRYPGEPSPTQTLKPGGANGADNSQYTRSHDNTRPATVVRSPAELAPTQTLKPGGANEVAPTQYDEQPQSVNYHPHFSQVDPRQQQSGFPLIDKDRQHPGFLQAEENKQTFEDQERAQISQPHYRDFLQNQNEELQLYRPLNEDKLRQEQLDQQKQKYHQPQHQPQQTHEQQQQHEQPQQQLRSPPFYDEIRGVEQPPRNRDPDTASFPEHHETDAALKPSEERIVYKKHAPRLSPYSYKAKKPVPLQPVYSKDQPPSFRDETRPVSITGGVHENEVFDHLPEYQESFGGNLPSSKAGESKEKRQAHHGHGGGFLDHNGLEFAAAASAAEHAHGKGGDGRLTFQLHGQKGPHSYRFGFDTGKGPHRQFRYEERDNDGTVKGRYGYYDSHGKLQMYNYSAHPEHGYEAAEAH